LLGQLLSWINIYSSLYAWNRFQWFGVVKCRAGTQKRERFKQAWNILLLLRRQPLTLRWLVLLSARAVVGLCTGSWVTMRSSTDSLHLTGTFLVLWLAATTNFLVFPYQSSSNLWMHFESTEIFYSICMSAIASNWLPLCRNGRKDSDIGYYR
jgi:hypothetical protein